MEPLVTVASVAVGLPIINIDTDQIFPARFMKQPRSMGYDKFLFHDMRRDGDAPASDFPLNDPVNENARIIVGRRNFGSGSSREAAVYALVDEGIRCVIAPSFGDIFASNAVNNGLLPACVSEDDAERLLALVAPGGVEVAVDLDACRIVAGGETFAFAIDPVWRVKLMNGWEDVDITRRYQADIDRWTQSNIDRRPWTAVRRHRPGV